jgi:arabinan endo-1,5-alpha-L-arabinosidase
VSIDFCCRGLDSTYKIAVGRSRSVTGPHYDELGTPLLPGGGRVVLSEHGQ